MPQRPIKSGSGLDEETRFLARLREIGVTEAEFDYVGRRRRLRRVSFGEISQGDVRKMMEQVEYKHNEKILDGLDDDTRKEIERRMRDDVAYHSS